LPPVQAWPSPCSASMAIVGLPRRIDLASVLDWLAGFGVTSA
jgi:hypothetical protein